MSIDTQIHKRQDYANCFQSYNDFIFLPGSMQMMLILSINMVVVAEKHIIRHFGENDFFQKNRCLLH